MHSFGVLVFRLIMVVISVLVEFVWYSSHLLPFTAFISLPECPVVTLSDMCYMNSTNPQNITIVRKV